MVETYKKNCYSNCNTPTTHTLINNGLVCDVCKNSNYPSPKEIKFYVVRDLIHLLGDSQFYNNKTKEDALKHFEQLQETYKEEIAEDEEIYKEDLDCYKEISFDDGQYYHNLQYEEVTL